MAIPRGAGRARQGGPQEGAAFRARRVRARGRPGRSGGRRGGAVGAARAGAGADPLRPHDRVAVPLLPRGGRGHGRGPGAHAPLGAAGPAVRGRAHAELPAAGLAGAAADVRHQRLRRDPAGPLGVGRQAPGRQSGHRGPRERLLGGRARGGGACCRRRLPPPDARLRGDGQPAGLVHAFRGGPVAAAVRADAGRRGRGALGACPRPGPGARHTAGLRQADAGDRRQTSDRPRSPAVAAAARPARRRRPRRPGEGDRPARRTVRPHPAARPPLPAGAVPARRLRAQGRRGRQCGYPLLDPAPARQGRRGSAVPAGEGGRGVGPGPVRGGGAVPFAGRAGGRRAAPDAGDQRHLPRLGAPVRRRRASARLLRAAVARLEGHRGGREPDPRHDDALR